MNPPLWPDDVGLRSADDHRVRMGAASVGSVAP